MKRKVLISFYNSEVNEGGTARNWAFKNFLEYKEFKTINLYSIGKFERVLTIQKVLKTLIKLRDSIIVIHVNSFISTLLVEVFSNKLYVRFLCKVLRHISKNNKLILEINDLRSEQAIDLELKIPSRKFEIAEKKIIYQLPYAEYIFASNNMRDYAILKYNLNPIKCTVIINGGPEKSSINKNEFNNIIEYNKKIKFVYAGTLNKGRQIEKMLSIFNDINEVELYLIGTNGEWINHEYYTGNIKYIGSFNEEDAHEIVSCCDMGLIPYDEDRKYYNLCYPTKASFYITAGIPFLSTNLNELMRNFKNENIAVFKSIEDWRTFLLSFETKKVIEMKKQVNDIKHIYEWGNVLKPIENIIGEE